MSRAAKARDGWLGSSEQLEELCDGLRSSIDMALTLLALRLYIPLLTLVLALILTLLFR